MHAWRVVSSVLLSFWLLQTAYSAESLRATRPDSFQPVTLEEGKPKFEIPPDSPLARNEHPRFLVVKEDLETLRRRLADPRLAAEFQALKRRAAGTWGNRPGWLNCTHALLWKLTGDRQYLEAIRRSPQFKRPTWIFGWAATMDLIWDDLTADERKQLSDLVAKAVSRDGSQFGPLYWRPTLHLVNVFYEGGKGPNDEIFLARMKRDFDQTLVRWTDKLNQWAAGRGGSDMSHGYNGEHAYWEPFVAAIAWSHATGQDYIGRAAFTRYQSPFYWYHFLPNRNPLTVEKIGVTRSADDSGAVSPSHSGANNLLFLTFTREDDGLGLAWMEKFRSQEPAWNRDREALGRFLWWNPNQKSIDPATLPTTRLFPTSGHVTMRSDWSEGATFATFRCGRYGEIDGSWGRNNADNLSFTIRKLGPLAIDSGPVHGQNATVLKFFGEGGDAGIPVIGNYGRQTIAHNSITVGDGEYIHRDYKGNHTGNVVRRGGQSVPQARDWWKPWGFPGPQRDFMEGRITAYRTHPLYDYACGDARFSYPPEWGVEQITRQFVYLKPDVFVVYDRLVVTDPAKKPCWMLHSLREPRATGEERLLSPEEIGPQFFYNGTEKIPHPSPGGHVRMGGEGFTVESGSPGKPGSGWLSVRTLRPAESECEREKIGGKGHDFEVGGVQYGLAEEGYKRADDSYAVRSTIGLLGWRVELRPSRPSTSVEFLHVMQVGVNGQAPDAVRGATYQATSQTGVVTVRQGGRLFTLRLNRTGEHGGSIAVEGPRVKYDESLPETVEDHWRYFKDDPNFKNWMTDPRYRIVIEPTEQDRQLAAASAPLPGANLKAANGPEKTRRRARVEAHWLDPDKTEPPGTKYCTFPSKTIGQDVSYHVYLPPDYEAHIDRRYPVIYWLHGLGGTQQTGARFFVPHLDAAVRQKVMPPVIAVMVNGMVSSFYNDSPDGKFPVESVIIKDLIPHVDATYRTIAKREGRAVQGYSMGGWGAAHLGFKYPELFGVVCIDAGALLEADAIRKHRAGVVESAFGDDMDNFAANHPRTLIENNADRVRGRTFVRIGVGANDNLLAVNREYHAWLDRLRILHDYEVVPDVAHMARLYYAKLGAKGFAFYDRALAGSAGQ